MAAPILVRLLAAQKPAALILTEISGVALMLSDTLNTYALRQLLRAGRLSGYDDFRHLDLGVEALEEPTASPLANDRRHGGGSSGIPGGRPNRVVYRVLILREWGVLL